MVRGHLLYRWNRWGKVWVYEGDYGVAVGKRGANYYVFAAKKRVGIGRDGKVEFKEESRYVGCFKTRKEAASLVKEIDRTMLTEGEVTEIVVSGPVGGKEAPVKAFIQSDPKTGGTLIFHRKEDVEGKIHEGSHYILGHLKRGVGRPRTSLREEKEAVEVQIRWHRLREEYTPEIRESIIKHLSTYFGGKDEKIRFKRAEKFVRGVEGK